MSISNQPEIVLRFTFYFLYYGREGTHIINFLLHKSINKQIGIKHYRFFNFVKVPWTPWYIVRNCVVHSKLDRHPLLLCPRLPQLLLYLYSYHLGGTFHLLTQCSTSDTQAGSKASSVDTKASSDRVGREAWNRVLFNEVILSTKPHCKEFSVYEESPFQALFQTEIFSSRTKISRWAPLLQSKQFNIIPTLHFLNNGFLQEDIKQFEPNWPLRKLIGVMSTLQQNIQYVLPQLHPRCAAWKANFPAVFRMI